LNPCGFKFFGVPEAFGYDLFWADVYEALSASQSTRIYLINVEADAGPGETLNLRWNTF